MKRVLSILLSRAVIVSVIILLQLAVFIGGIYVLTMPALDQYFPYLYACLVLISAMVVLHILNTEDNPAYKIAWIIPIMLAPVFGGLFYVLFAKNRFSKKQRIRASEILKRYDAAMQLVQDDADMLGAENPEALVHARYLSYAARSPVCADTKSTYLPTGEAYFSRLMEELKKAEKFIYIEMFIITPGKMWGDILEVLEEKAKEGVDVRVLYDDFGSIFTLPSNYNRILEKKGIKACAFNRFSPVLSLRFNNRDHRKIIVIDGKVGFTGGINLADEYINERERFGHWKDCGVVLEGKGVFSLCALFLCSWDFVYGSKSDFYACMPDFEAKPAAKPLRDGFVQVFGDVPLDKENCAENVYLHIITRACRYIYINTPYLILDDAMLNALTLAAKSGVDVRIMLPHIPDKRYVHALSRAHYAVLVESGVKVYEYAPGFIHSKTFVCDDSYAVIGTVNLDYRSLYLHYECAAMLYGTQSAQALKEDFLEVLHRDGIQIEAAALRVGFFTRLVRSILRVFAPLM